MLTMLHLLAGGILALPAFVVLVVAALLLLVLAAPSLVFLVFRKSRFSVKDDDNDNGNGDGSSDGGRVVVRKQHAIITGGSSGIGLAIAQECVRRKFSRVTILARNTDKLDDAQQLLLQQQNPSGTTKIQAISVDVSNPSALEVVAQQIMGKKDDEEEDKETTYLFANAGITYPECFEAIPSSVFSQQAHVNYLGTIFTVRAFYPFLHHGTIILTSSAAGQIGVFGFTSYSSSKYALRGFAESLHMELLSSKPHVNVQVVYPPDTNTPGYAQEQEMKPKACEAISGIITIVEPEVIACRMVTEAQKSNPKFSVYFGLEGWMLSTLTAGMSPESSFLDALCQVSLMSLLRLISFFYLNDMWSTIQKCNTEQQQQQ